MAAVTTPRARWLCRVLSPVKFRRDSMASTIGRKSYARITDSYHLPSLIEVQLDSFKWLRDEGLSQLFDEITPVESFNKGMKLFFPSRAPESKEFGLKYWFEDSKYSPDECLDRAMTSSPPRNVQVLLAGPEAS